jgi:N-acyl-D-aspartate/D-glutamate deacylase
MAAGFKDRGVAPADIVVYDCCALHELPTERAYDYPAGAWRLVKKAEGYRYTIVNGEATFEDGVAPRRNRLSRHALQSGRTSRPGR